MRVGAIILAAGSSSRMGTPKQLLQFRGTSLLRRATLAALNAGCTPVVVVTGANADASRHELDGLDVREAFNTDWQAGMASSIRAGVESLGDLDVDAVVLLLCDQPYVISEVITGLIDAHRVSGKPVVASSYGDTFGVPALFGRVLLGELAQLQGTVGAKQVIASHRSEAHFVPFEGGDVDVDTPDDWRRLNAEEVPTARVAASAASGGRAKRSRSRG